MKKIIAALVVSAAIASPVVAQPVPVLAPVMTSTFITTVTLVAGIATAAAALNATTTSNH